MTSTIRDPSDPMKELVASVEVRTHLLGDDGVFPNHAHLPLLFYPQALRLANTNQERKVQDLLATNQWHNSWVNGLYAYHHYHSTAHEVLVIFAGSAEVQFGGPQGIRATVQAGDGVMIPAGMAHKRLNSHGGFTVIGAYPRGQDVDMCYGEPGERPQADARIAALAVPEMDPLYGRKGPLAKHWHAHRE